MYRLILLLCVLIKGACYTQEPVSIQYTSQNGLPGNMIYDIYRDSDGFLWFGTDNGVARFNGIKFETYSTADGLADNEIFFFKEDHEQRLWMSTFNGELCYYKRGVFYNASNKHFLKLPVKSSDTKFITVHKDSSISFCLMGQPAYFINIKGEHLKIINTGHLQLEQIINISKPDRNSYLIYSHDKCVLIDSNATLVSTEVFKGDSYYRCSYTQDSVYLFNKRGIYNRDRDLLFSFNGMGVDSIVRVFFRNRMPVIVKRQGLVMDGKTMLVNEKLSSVTQDVNGDLWVGTLGNGVYRFKRNYDQYKLYRKAYDGVVTYAHNNKGRPVFSTSANKLYQLNSNGASPVVSIPAKGYNGRSFQYIDDRHFYSFSGNRLSVVSYQPVAPARVYYFTPGFQSDGLKSFIANDSEAYLHYSGNVYRASLGRQTNGRIADDQFSGFSGEGNVRILYMDKDSGGNIWYAAGKMYMIAGNLSIAQRQFNGLSLEWFSNYRDVFIGITQHNRLVVAKNAGKTGLKYKTIQENCKWERAYRIDNEHILISTNNQYRLLTLIPSVHDSLSFSIKPVENEFLPVDAEYIVSDDSNMYCLKKGNIHVVSLSALLSDVHPPRISAVLFKTAKRYYNTNGEIVIPQSEAKNISISFHVQSFESKSLAYQYSISKDGTDNWHSIKNEEINLFELDNGSYTVKIRATTQSGIKSRIFVLYVKVLKPFYLHWWFFAIITIAALALVFLAVRLWINYVLSKREKAHQLKLKVVKSEYKALNALMNPHFVFNSLNSIQGFINKGNKTSANQYLHLFSSLIRQNMHNLTKEVVLLSEEIKLVEHYLQLETIRFKDSFEYIIDVQEDIDDADIFIPPLLIQPLVENAIKHGLLPKKDQGNKLWVRIRMNGEHLIVEIEDNGVGFPDTTPANISGVHGSYALKNIYSRITQLNDLYGDAIQLEIISNEVNPGTKVMIRLDTEKLSHNGSDRS